MDFGIETTLAVILMVLITPSHGLFKYFEEEKTWVEALKFCHDQGGRLAIEDSNDLISEIPPGKQTVWTGRYTAGVWLWLTGCYNEAPSVSSPKSQAFKQNSNVTSMMQCIQSCSNRKTGIALQENRCYCLQTLHIKNNKNKGSFCDTACSYKSSRYCGGILRLSVYSFISDNTSVSYNSGEKRLASCGTAQLSNGALQFGAKDCNAQLPGLCKHGAKTNADNWLKTFKDCSRDFAIPSENDMAEIQTDYEYWVGLVRENFTSSVDEQRMSDVPMDLVDCISLNKQGDNIPTLCNVTSGFICSLSQKITTTSTAENTGKDVYHPDKTGSSTVIADMGDNSSKTGDDNTLVLIACSAAGALILIIVVCVVCFVWQRKKRQDRSPSNIDPNSPRKPVYAQVDQEKKKSAINTKNPVHYSDVKLNEEDYDELPKPGEVRRANPEEEGHYDHTRNLNPENDYDEIPKSGHIKSDADDTYDHTSGFKSSMKRANDTDDPYDHTSHFKSSMKRANDADDTYDHTSKFQSSVKLANDADDTYDHTSKFQSSVKLANHADDTYDHTSSYKASQKSAKDASHSKHSA